MLRLKANKTSLYKLVSDYEGGLPPMRRTRFAKADRRPDYSLEWTDTDGRRCQAFFCVSAGRALLTIERKRPFEPERSRVVHGLAIGDLQARGMVEEFVTAEERRQAEGRAADNGIV